tara:strand:+ start:1565 stop:1780 length:216 start_codon:yes stop_codon:yes gene_type:complete
MTPQELKSVRHALDLSVKGLADALTEPGHKPVNPRTVRRWEDGTQDIQSPVAVALRLMLREKKRQNRLNLD